MRVLNISHNDYANYSYHNAEALKSVGVDAKSYAVQPHSFEYLNQSEIRTQNEIVRDIRAFDIIQLMHPDKRLLNVCNEAKRLNKTVVVWFTGSKYRQNHVNSNNQWRWVDKIMVALPEFVKLSGGEYFGITFDVDGVEPNYDTNDVLTIGHYPSNRETKGSDTVDRLAQSVEGIEYKTGKLLPHPEHMERMKTIDVYIEMMNLKQNGKEYGSYGTTAIEVAALGCIVITNDLNKNIYTNTYGDTALRICNSEGAIIEEIERLKAMSKEEIIQLKKNTRKWAEDKHSYKAQGQRLKDILWSIKRS